MLHARDITCSLGETKILHGIGIDVQPGEVVALIGANGAGKSTFLRILTGDIRASSGQVIIDEQPIESWSTRALARRRAVVHQSSSTQFPMTAYDIVSLGRLSYRRQSTAEEDRRVVLQSARAVGVESLLMRPYPTLSGGESQRVQLARALAQLGASPAGKLLVLDEPTSALDPSHVASFLTLMRSLANSSNIAVLCVLHDLNAVLAAADRVVALRDGHVVATGQTDAVLAPELLANIYGPGLSLLESPDGKRAIVPSLAGPPGLADSLDDTKLQPTSSHHVTP